MTQVVTVYTRPGCQPCVATKRDLRVDGEVLTLPEVCMDCMAVRGTRALVATIQSEAGFRHRRNKDDKR